MQSAPSYRRWKRAKTPARKSLSGLLHPTSFAAQAQEDRGTNPHQLCFRAGRKAALVSKEEEAQHYGRLWAKQRLGLGSEIELPGLAPKEQENIQDAVDRWLECMKTGAD
jgi:hypothetical protein